MQCNRISYENSASALSFFVLYVKSNQITSSELKSKLGQVNISQVRSNELISPPFSYLLQIAIIIASQSILA